MTKLQLLVVVLLLPLALLANVYPSSGSERALFSDKIIKVKLTRHIIAGLNLPVNLSPVRAETGSGSLDQIVSSRGIATINRAYIPLKDKRFEETQGIDRWVQIRWNTAINVLEALESLKALEGVVEDASLEYIAYPHIIPNDTLYPYNWGHNNTAQLPHYQNGSFSGSGVGTVGFDARAQTAWNGVQGYGSSSIVIGIIDTAFDIYHPDLRFVSGYDYGNNDSNPLYDDASQSHGTAVAGIAAARANNALGVAGIAGGCSIMPLKVADTAGVMYFTAIENALYHCANNAVPIASMSFGSAFSYGSYPSTDTAITYAYNNGVFLVASAGNDDTSSINYPANHPLVMSVGSASPTGQRKSPISSDGVTTWGSNYGSPTRDAADAVDIMAPTHMPTTDITGTAGYNSSDYNMWFGGTSASTPYVAGVAALLLSKSNTLSPPQIRQLLTTTTTDMTSDGGAGWDRYTGYGLVNAAGALSAITAGSPYILITYPPSGGSCGVGDLLTITVSATDPTNRSVNRVDYYLDGAGNPSFSTSYAPYSWTWNTAGYSSGNHIVRAVVVDNNNNTASHQITVNLIGLLQESFETANFNSFPWVHSGNLGWSVSPADGYSGYYAGKSGLITDSQSSTLSISLNVLSPSNISFFRRVSSETNYDFLRFYIDGALQTQWSGELGWSQLSYPVSAGVRTFSWTYSKDSSVATGSDCAWIDLIAFPPFGQLLPANIVWDPLSSTTNLASNLSSTRTISIANSGNLSLNYNCYIPTGQMTLLDETFAGTSLPAGWTEEFVTGGTPWLYTVGGYAGYPATAYDGNYNARLFYNGLNNTTKLITPAINLSNSSSASLSFWHAQVNWGTQDELRVYYKTSFSGSWNLLATYTQNTSAWTQRVLTLPNPNSTYYIAFQGTANYGFGVCLDKIVVTSQMPSTPPSWLRLNGGLTVSGTIANAAAAQNIAMQINSSGLSVGTYNYQVILSSNSNNNSVVSIPVTLNVLAQPQISVNTTSLAYGTVQINTTLGQYFQISNAGNATLSGTISTPANYTVASLRFGKSIGKRKQNSLQVTSARDRNVLSYSIAAGSSMQFILSFNPTALQNYNGTVVITHNAVGENASISVSGQGGKASLGASSLSFSAQIAPGGTNTQSLSISNSGNMALNYALNVTGAPGWIKLNGLSSVTGSIASGASSQSISVGFNALGLAPGTYNAVVSGSSNDPQNLSFNIAINLTVIAPLTLVNPAGGELLYIGADYNLQWNYAGTGSTVSAYYSIDGGANWLSIGEIQSQTGQNNYAWQPGTTASTNAKLKLVDSISPFYSVISPSFSIAWQLPPSIPQELSINLDTETGAVSLSWAASTGSPSGYQVYISDRPDPAENELTLLATLPANQTNYIDLQANNRIRCFYLVKSFRN